MNYPTYRTEATLVLALLWLVGLVAIGINGVVSSPAFSDKLTSGLVAAISGGSAVFFFQIIRRLGPIDGEVHTAVARVARPSSSVERVRRDRAA